MRIFNSPTKGKMDFETVISEIVNFIREDPLQIYKLVVGTDSEGKSRPIFVIAVAIHRKGKGGRYFWTKVQKQKKYTLRNRIYEETMLSLNLAIVLRQKLEERLKEIYPLNYENLEIHTDIGENGETKDMIKEIVGMIRGNGFLAKIKPESYGASTVADKYT